MTISTFVTCVTGRSSGLGTFENTPGVYGSLPDRIRNVVAVAHQAAGHRRIRADVDRSSAVSWRDARCDQLCIAASIEARSAHCTNRAPGQRHARLSSRRQSSISRLVLSIAKIDLLGLSHAQQCCRLCVALSRFQEWVRPG